MPVTIEEVEWCYRFILEREPEDHQIVERHVSSSQNFPTLVLKFLQSREYKQKRGFIPSFIPLNNPAMHVELDATPVELAALTERIRRAWSHMGSSYPHHSVLTHKDFLPQNLDTTALDRFWLSGEQEAAVIAAVLQRNEFCGREFKTAVEYGCGLGRVTLPLAGMFQNIHAYDISDTHLEAAEAAAHARGVSNITFHLCSEAARFDLEPCEFFYSRIVFQHNPPPLMRATIRQCLQSLRPGGIAVFQVPTYRPNYTFQISEYLKRQPSKGMEMHCIPQSEIFSICDRTSCEVLEVREDGSTGRPGEWLSNTFVVRRKADANCHVIGFQHTPAASC